MGAIPFVCFTSKLLPSGWILTITWTRKRRRLIFYGFPFPPPHLTHTYTPRGNSQIYKYRIRFERSRPSSFRFCPPRTKSNGPDSTSDGPNTTRGTHISQPFRTSISATLPPPYNNIFFLSLSLSLSLSQIGRAHV